MIKEIATNRHSSEAFMFTCHCCSKCTGLSSQGQVTAKTANSIQGSHWKKAQFVSYVSALLSGAGKNTVIK